MKSTPTEEKYTVGEIEGSPPPGAPVNASGHVQQLDRIFGLLTSCSMSIALDNAWAAGGGALVVALSNGGPPGVLYEFMVACTFYCFIGASLAELASAIPSSGGVYHWASVTAGPKYGRICSWYAGWWNAVAYIVNSAGISYIIANSALAMYTLYHPEYTMQRWHAFVAYVIITSIEVSAVLFGQRFLPVVARFGVFLVVGGGLVTTLVVAIMPSTTGKGYASSASVWRDWTNRTGYSSNGFVFLAGMLNGAWTIGTPDAVCHLAEEIPQPKRNLPKAIAAQLTVGTVTTLVYYIALVYAITSLPDVLNTNITALPLGGIYLQATGSPAGACGLLSMVLLSMFMAGLMNYMTAARCLWTLARDNATPWSPTLAHVSPTFGNPFNATLASAIISIILGALYVGSSAAFSAIISCFVILTTLSYLAAILPHILTGRKHVKPGPFWMPGIWGYIVSGISCAYIIVFDVIFCFPYVVPATPQNMNYASVIIAGFTAFFTIWWLWKGRRGYVGPKVLLDNDDDAMKGRGFTMRKK